MKNKLVISLLAGTIFSQVAIADEIIHDAEYYILKSQHEAQWKEDDQSVDAKLTEYRNNNKGKSPNILYVLVDDLSFGEMGIPEMNYVRGSQTPRINQFADESISFMRMYTEPSCTPSRVAMMTGRHPVRNGLGEVKATVAGEALAASEVTIAEVLSDAGYNTVHIGKWHMGDIAEGYPHNQGFDYASFPIHQQVLLGFMTPESDQAHVMQGWVEGSDNNPFALDKTFKPNGLVYGLEATKGELAREVDFKAGEQWTQKHYDAMNDKYQRETLEQLRELSKKEEPFFLQYWPLIPLEFDRSAFDKFDMQNGGTGVESLHKLDKWFGQILDEVDKLGITEDTLIVLMADNGRFRQFDRVLGFSGGIYRGGKVDTQEGAVRVNAFARWPGMIKADQLAGDMIHISDLYTTFAHIGNAKQYIPRDRVIDGLDQTALFLEGEGKGRRDYAFIYSGNTLRSIVKQKYKLELPEPGQPGVAAKIYDLQRDPREESPMLEVALWASASYQDIIARHIGQMQKYPNAKVGSGRPYSGIENLRPESKKMVDFFMGWKNQN
ncbi:sulfatase-like hydrolase/transferase [Rubritalea marina]|uniref:sulfatase-like hydrolase/transferase n=1 Tax=Rubritalea marina TaxID=361055 RepID=UPI000368448C|nr:sulfatase-like hydrolase/transferase [Rubritalea marina]